jgi:hypothetical protein
LRQVKGRHVFHDGRARSGGDRRSRLTFFDRGRLLPQGFHAAPYAAATAGSMMCFRFAQPNARARFATPRE